MKNLNTKLKHILYTIFLLMLFTFCSCGESKTQNSTKKYIVQTTHDNNWTTSASIECDSVTMVSQNEVVLWVDGREMKMIAPMFKIFNNPYFGVSK